MRDESREYSPIYHAERNLYDSTITIYGVIGRKIYRGCTGKQAMQRYHEEWEQQDAAMAF